MRTGNRAADSAAGLLPPSVPRGVGKIGLVGVGGLVAFWVLQKVGVPSVFLPSFLLNEKAALPGKKHGGACADSFDFLLHRPAGWWSLFVGQAVREE